MTQNSRQVLERLLHDHAISFTWETSPILNSPVLRVPDSHFFAVWDLIETLPHGEWIPHLQIVRTSGGEPC